MPKVNIADQARWKTLCLLSTPLLMNLSSSRIADELDMLIFCNDVSSSSSV